MEFVKVYDSVLSPLICDYLMLEINSNELTSKGVVGTDKLPRENIKDTMDLFVNNIKDENIRGPLINYVRHTITLFLKLYVDDINKIVHNGHIPFDNIEDFGFQIQKYTMNEGKYIFHNDFMNDGNKHRVLTFLFYLNDVEEGGETEFYDGTKIKPEKGKLLLFPACWTYVHKGNMPVSSDKYILTGWLYSD